MKLEVTNFKGEVPRIEPNLLPDGYSQKAMNTRLQRGHLSPQRAVEIVNVFGTDVQTAYLHGPTWLGWNAKVNVVPGPVADDRLYITGLGLPKIRRPNGVTEDLKVPTPVDTPVASLSGVGTDPTIIHSILYVVTFVTDLGEESLPSSLSNSIDWSPGQAITVDFTVAVDPERGINKVRLYQSQTTSFGATDLFFIAEANYTDGIPISMAVAGAEGVNLQEPISTKDFDQPIDTLSGLISLPNGMMAGFSGKELYFCEPFQPHAWPEKYMLTTDFEIVGLASFGTNLAILTKGTPYMAQGSAPENMLLQKLEQNYPCVSASGIVDMGYAAAYPSHEGLVTIDASGAKLITSGLFTREQWVEMDPSTIDAALFNGRYLFSYIPLATTVGEGYLDTYVQMGVINITGQQPFYIEGSDQMVGLFQDVLTGQAFGITGSRNVVRWDSDDSDHMGLEWTSAKYSLRSPTSFGAYFIEAEPFEGEIGTFSMTIWADGISFFTATSVNEISRLPSGLSSRWWFEIETNMTIKRVSIAGTPDEIGVG